MMIHGFGFLGLSASLLLPWALTGMVQGQKIIESLVRDIPQSSPVQEKPLPSRKLISQASPTTYYVSGSGSDQNSGLSASSPFRTIQRAADLTNPGDTVLIMNGVYTNASGYASVVTINRSGNANGWITYRAYPGHSPKIQHNTWNGILFPSGVSYIEVSGLEVAGNNQNITYAYAVSQQQNASNPLTSGNCINMDGRNARVHHIKILNNRVHDCGGAGITAIGADYVQVNNNTVFNNAWYGVYGNSGISFLQNTNIDTNQGYKIYILNNIVYNNQMYIPWISTGTFTDGNGIIVDSSIRGLNGAAYQGRTLIANNVSSHNGGTGIHTYETEHVDIMFNTTYLNSQTPEINNGQIMSNFSNDINVVNNILYAEPNRRIIFNNQSTNVTFNYNLYNNNGNGYPVNAVGPNDIMADPQFTNASIGNFTLQPWSQAINSAYPSSFVTTNILGSTRSSTPNRGAY